MAAAVSRAFDMVFTGLSYMGNNSAGKMRGTGQTDGWLCIYSWTLRLRSSNVRRDVSISKMS